MEEIGSNREMQDEWNGAECGSYLTGFKRDAASHVLKQIRLTENDCNQKR